MPGTLVASELTTVGVAKETTLNTPVAPSNQLRLTSWAPKFDPTFLPDESMRGSMAGTYDQIAGTVSTDLDFGGNLYADEIGWFLAGILGDVTVTGSSDPYSTVIGLLNSGTGQPPSYTFTDYNGNQARAFSGSLVDEVSIAYADGLATYTASAMGMGFATASTPTPSFPTTRALAAWRNTVGIAGSSAMIVQGLTVDIKRTVIPVFGQSNSQTPLSNFAAGDLKVTGSLTVVYDRTLGETVLNYCNGATKVAISSVLTTTDPTNSHSVGLQMSSTQFTTDDEERGAGNFMTLSIDFEAIANATDIGASAGYSPIKATLANEFPTGTYK